jgi:uncharacterized membrane protein
LIWGKKKDPNADPSVTALTDDKSDVKSGSRIPFFVSVYASELYDLKDTPTMMEIIMAAVDVVLHVAAWVTAVVLDAVLFANEGFHFVMPAYAAMYAAVVSVAVAGGVVILLTMRNVYNRIKLGGLPASTTSLVTGGARASSVFTGFVIMILSFQLMLADAVPTYAPTNLATTHVMRMLVASLALKLYGTACTLNNHRLKSNDVNVVTTAAS